MALTNFRPKRPGFLRASENGGYFPKADTEISNRSAAANFSQRNSLVPLLCVNEPISRRVLLGRSLGLPNSRASSLANISRYSPADKVQWLLL